MKKVISETIEETRHFRMKVPHEGTPIAPEIKNFKAHKARQMMVVPAPSVDQKESTGCPHKKQKRACVVCNPCPHGKLKSNCVVCSGCPHGKQKGNCVVCSGCPHRKVKYRCAECNPRPHIPVLLEALNKMEGTLGLVELMKKKETEKFVDDDMEILAMWERGEHTCEMYDAFCLVCEKDQKGGQDIEADMRLLTELLGEDYDGEVRVLTEEEALPKPPEGYEYAVRKDLTPRQISCRKHYEKNKQKLNEERKRLHDVRTFIASAAPYHEKRK
jgi:hypothetical protein